MKNGDAMTRDEINQEDQLCKQLIDQLQHYISLMSLCVENLAIKRGKLKQMRNALKQQDKS